MPDIIENYIPRYDIREQIEAVQFQEPLPSYFRSEFFKGAPVYSPTETIEWDEVREGAGMARYVAEHLEVEATAREGYITREITTPKVQEKRVLTLAELKKRLPGENVYSAKTKAERAQEYRNKDLNFCMTAIDRRVEQQCAQMMTTGRIDILGSGVNAYIDYELPLKLSLSGTARWGQSGVKPLDTLTMMAKALRKRNYTPNGLLMELSVSKVFLQDEDIKEYLDNRRFEMGIIKPGELNDQFGSAQYFGTFAYPGLGILELYTYDGTYKNDENKETPYLDEGRILMLTNEARQNRILYGAYDVVDENEQVLTVEGNYVPEDFVDRRAKTFTTMVTSRPMPAPYKGDSWWTAKVL